MTTFEANILNSDLYTLSGGSRKPPGKPPITFIDSVYGGEPESTGLAALEKETAKTLDSEQFDQYKKIQEALLGEGLIGFARTNSAELVLGGDSDD